MNYRELGKTGLKLSEIGYGAWGLGGNQWRGATDDEGLRALRRAFELGLNFIDTALAYNEGHSERLISQAMKDAPRRVYVATKIPPRNRIWPAPPGIALEEVFPSRYMVESTETSLRNLAVETIDLQQLHVWDPGWLQRDEWRRTFEDLKQSGKVRAVGISINDHQPNTALDVVASGAIDSVQVIYNIFDQSPAVQLFPVAGQHSAGVIVRVPFDEGSLTGSIDENTEFEEGEFRAAYFRGDRKRQVRERVERLRADLQPLAEPLAEVALRFCLSNPQVTTVIPGMRKVRNVESSCSVSERGSLSNETLEKLRAHVWTKNFYD